MLKSDLPSLTPAQYGAANELRTACWKALEYAQIFPNSEPKITAFFAGLGSGGGGIAIGDTLFASNFGGDTYTGGVVSAGPGPGTTVLKLDAGAAIVKTTDSASLRDYTGNAVVNPVTVSYMFDSSDSLFEGVKLGADSVAFADGQAFHVAVDGTLKTVTVHISSGAITGFTTTA